MKKILAFQTQEDNLTIQYDVITDSKLSYNDISQLDSAQLLTKVDNLLDTNQQEINKLSKRINNIGYNFEYDENVLDFILERIKDESEFGARPIMRAIPMAASIS
ncbi:MAG: hypothetical protein IIU96_03770, partial [Paludibacteraceae bacterium]|nr:hypothetical protein [Paludibacteraceae bacterium]